MPEDYRGVKIMPKATLIIMAGGLGSRFGGLKQLAKIGENGEKIIDYSIYDAKRAGFDRVVFVIKQENLQTFKAEIGDTVAKHIQVDYVFQSTDLLPDGFSPDPAREKPLGTGHAVWCCRNIVNEPFAVINADDYYGPKAFQLVYDFLMRTSGSNEITYCMAGYVLQNTLTEFGTVSRGICKTDADGFLTSVTEHKKLRRGEGCALSELDNGAIEKLPLDSVVSMNFWGFTPDFFTRLDGGLRNFLQADHADPLKAEFFLPEVADQCTRDEYAKITVLKTDDRWYGVTYQEDKAAVSSAIKALVNSGLYPNKLWA